MNRKELLEHLCPSKNRERCRNENISCNECDIVINTYLDEYDKHVIAQYEAEHGNLADMIRDIHDCVYQQGKADVVNKLLSICGSFPNNNDCIECSFAIWKDNEWNGCYIEQLKEQE